MKKTVALLLSLLLMLQPVLGSAAFMLPSALRSIQAEAFVGNKAITGNLELPGNVASVGERAFADTDLWSLWLPAATVSVGSRILEGAGASYVVVENAKATLADSAFADVSILFGKENSTTQRYAQSNDLGFFELENLYWNDGFVYYRHGDFVELVTGAVEHSGSVTIPQSVAGYPVAMVSGYAFMHQDSVTSIALPDTASADMPAESARTDWPAAGITFYATGVDPVIPPEADPENGGVIVELDIVPASVTLMPGETFAPVLSELPEGDYIYSSYSTDESIVAIDENGDAFAAAPGSAAFTVTAVPNVDGEATESELGVSAYYGTVQILVVEPEVSIDLFESTVSLNVGQVYYPRLDVKTPSSVSTPELTASSADPAIADAYIVNGELMLQPQGEGKTTITLTATVPAYGDYEAVSTSAEITVNVTPAAFETTYSTLYTYTGFEHDLAVTSALPEDAGVAFTTINELASYNEETGRVVVGDQAGESAVIVTVTYADGTQESVTVPVYIKPFLSFGEPQHRDDLNAGWEYHYEWENLMPSLEGELWPHDEGMIVTYAEAANEQLSIQNELTEGQNVIRFSEDVDEAGNVWVRSNARYPGSASVTYYATLNADLLPDSAHAPVASSEPVEITVLEPDVQAVLDSDLYTIYAIDGQTEFGFWWEGPYDVQYEKFTSSDESIFTVNPAGLLIAHSEGHATLTYTIHCYGVESTATADVYVNGSILTLEPAEVTIGVGESVTVSPVLPEGTDGSSHEFYSNREEIATVSHTGIVTGRNVGTALISYRTDSHGFAVNATAIVHVVDDGARLDLNETYVELYEGETFQLEAIFAQGDEPVSIEWESSAQAHVSVSENGVIQAVGNAWAYPARETIACTATFADGSTETAYCLVVGVEPIVYVTNILGYYDLTVGQTEQFSDWATFTDGYTFEDFAIYYESEDENIVSVDEDGLMTALAQGVVKVSVVYELDGRIVARKGSLVHVDTPVPQLGEDDSIEFVTDHFFMPTPPEGEVIGNRLDYAISDESLWAYYYPLVTGVSDPEGAITVYDDGGVQFSGEGTADLFVTLVPYDESVVVPEGFGGSAKLTVGTPEFEITVADWTGENAAPLSEENPIDPGDTVTITLVGVPEDIGHRHIGWDYDDYLFREIARADRTLTLQAQHPGQSHLGMDIDLECDAWIDVSSELYIEGDENAPDMGMTAVQLAVGETVEIHPAFPDWEDGSFSAVAAWDEAGNEADPSEIIELGEEFPQITAVGLGRVELTATVTLDGETLNLPVYITVVESEWSLNNWDLEDVMYLGQHYDPQMDIRYNGYHCPEITFSFSDDSLMEMDYDNWRLTPLAAGEVTVTATIEKDGRTETAAKDVTIIEPSLTFVGGPYMELSSGQSEILTLVNNTGNEILSVSWTNSHSGHASLNIDEHAPLSAVVTACGNYTGQWVSTLVTATVAFMDGTTEAVSAAVSIRPEYEIHLETWLDEHYIELYPGETYEIPMGWDGELTGLTVTTSDERIVTTSANGILNAVAPGEAEITVRFETYGGVYEEEHATVVVRNFKASLNPASLDLAVGESAYVVPTVELGESGYWVNDQRTFFWSMDDSVASVDHLGLVTAKAPGSTVIVYETYTFYDDHHLIAYCPVTVSSGEGGLTLSETEISLRPREEFQLTAAVNGELDGEITWTSSNPDIITVVDGLVKLTTWDVYEAVQAGSVFATATVDGEETTAVCKINILPAAVSLFDAPNFYELSVGERAIVQYNVSVNDPAITYYASFLTTDETIATVDESGVLTAVGEGVCMVRLNLTDESGRLLCSGAAYVYVDTPLPSPADEGAAIRFEADHYYMTMQDGWGKHRSAFIVDPMGLGVYYDLHVESDDENIVYCHGGDHIEAMGEGTTTIRAWYEGFEEYAATATVTVGNPYLTFDKPVDENGNPIVTLGDTLTVTLNGMPTFGNMDPTTQITPRYVNLHKNDDVLREIARGIDEEGNNTFTLHALDNGGADVSLEMELECGWWGGFDFFVNIDELDAEYFMERSAVAMATGEEVEVWPAFGWQELVSVESSDDAVVSVLATEEGSLMLTGEGVGHATITAQYMLDDDEGTVVTATISVSVVENYWYLTDLNGIDDVMVVGQLHNPWPTISCSGFYGPEISWETSDESILTVEDVNGEGEMYAIPHAPGVITLTVTATEGDESASMSKEIIVTEPKVYFADREPSIRPGQTRFLPLVIVNDTDEKIVNNITYYSEDAGLVSVEDGLLEYGSPAAKLTCVKTNNSTRIFAVVEFMDGSVATAACRVWPLDNGEIWVDAYTDDLWLSTEPWGQNPTVTGTSLWWTTNAALTKDPNNTGSDTAWVEWSIDDENVARIAGNDDPDWNNAPVIEAVGEGETILRATFFLYDAEGNEIVRNDVERTIFVEQPFLEITPDQDTYSLNQNDSDWVYIDWHYNEHGIGHITTEVYYSDDEGVAFCDQYGNVRAVNSGETDVHVDVYVNGYHVATGTAHIVVEGPSLHFWQDSATLAEGENLQLIVYPELNGAEQYSIGFSSDNEAVARVNENGLLYAVAPGRAVITCWLDTSAGNIEAQFVVNVTGETPAFALSASTLKLYPGASYTFTNDLSGYDSVSWRIEGHENISFDAETQTVYASHNDEAKLYTAVITCEAVKDGVTYSANCHVALANGTIQIHGAQFGPGAWHVIKVGETMDVFESYSVSSLSVETTVDIWTEDESIAVYDAERDVFVGQKVGDTMAYYRVTGSNGETHTVSAMLRVVNDYSDVWPESISALHTDHAFVVDLQNGERGFPYVTTPEYSGCDLFFFSGDDSVLSFSGEMNDGRMFLNGVGRTTVTVEPGEYAPESVESAQGEVLVLDSSRIVLAPVDENGNPMYDLPMGQTYQLTFTAVDGGILWEEDDVDHIVFDSFWNSEGNLLLSENGELNVISAWADSLWAAATVTFKDGSEMFFTYHFRPILAENQAYFSFSGIPLSRMVMPVNSRHDSVELICSDQGIVNSEFTSSDDSIANLIWNESNNDYSLYSYDKTGEVTITGMATLESGETVTASVQVIVLAGAAPDITLEASKSLLTIGEEVSFGMHAGNGFTSHPSIDNWYSSDESILEPIVNELGPTGAFRAVGIGEATVTAVVHYGGVYSNVTCTVYVTDYPVAYLDESHVDLRPDEKHQLILMENEFSTKNIASVQWAIDDDSIATFTPFEGNRSVSLTGVAKSGDTTIRVTVTDTDGGVSEYFATIHITTNDEVWVEPWHDDVWLSTESWGIEPQRNVVWQSWNHNASHFDEIGEGSDKAWIEWEIEDENIVVFDGFYEIQEGDKNYGVMEHAPWNNGPMVKAVSAGDTVIKTHLTLTDKDGNFLAECWDEIPVHVIAPTISIHAEQETYEVQVGRSKWVNWIIDGEDVRSETGGALYTDDPSIATFDMYGDIVGVKPGETTMHYDVVIGGKTFTASAKVIVTGPEFRFAQNEITISAGETADPGLILSANGYDFGEPEWYIANPGVVTMLSDGTLYGVSQGASYVYCEIDVDGIGYMEISMLVHVTGEAPAFALSSDTLTLWQESTAKLQIVSNTDETLNEETIRWSTSNENLITVDQEGNLTVHNGEEPNRDQNAAVFCDAETTSGEPVSMVCVVTVPAPSVRINEYQFWDGSWYAMNSGDSLGMWESYTLYDPSLTVDVQVTVDDESVVEYCYDSPYAWTYFQAVSEGATDAHYTVTASNGESYTRSARLLVDQDTTPERLVFEDLVEHDRSIAICLEDGDQYVHCWFEPAYTGAELRFYSSDESIVTVDEYNAVLHPQKAGHATIYVECPEMPELNTSFNVSVIEEANVRLVAADGRTTLGANDAVQLVFETTDGVMWNESDIYGFEFQPYYDEACVWVDENNVLHTRMNRGEEEITVRGVTWFMDGRGVAAEYTFSVDESEPYFFLSARDDGNGDHFTLAEGSGFHLYLNTNQPYDPSTLVYSSSNPDAVDFYAWDEEAGNFHVHAFGSGEAELTVTIPEVNMTATFPVRSFVPTEIDKYMSIQGSSTVVRVGDEFEMYTSFTDDELEYFGNMDDHHAYTVDNAAVADSIENIKIANGEEPGDRDWMTFRALAPGQVTITSTATYENYPELVDVDTMTITVLSAYPISMETDYADLTPGATVSFPITLNLDRDAYAFLGAQSENSAVATAEITHDEEGYPYLTITGVDAPAQANVVITARLTDGTEQTIAFTVNMVNGKIAILTGSSEQGEEEYAAALNMVSSYGSNIVLHDTYPDNFTSEIQTTIAKLKAFASDPSVKAIIACQSVPGVSTAFKQIAAMCEEEGRETPLLIMGVPQEDPSVAKGASDFVLSSNEPDQADTIAETIANWGVDVFVHYSFPRHLAMESVAGRRDGLKAHCEALGIEFVEVTIPDPTSDSGLAYTQEYVTSNVAAQMETYSGKKVAFFATVCGAQSALQCAVLANENAYYPQPCCPSPYHGFGESLGLSLTLGRDYIALRKIAEALNAHGAADRFSTWPSPVNSAIVEVATAYANSYVNGEIASRFDSDAVKALLEERFPGATVSHEDNYFTILLQPVDFTDYIQQTPDFSYEELADGSIHITAYNNAGTDVTIPTEIDGKKVSSFGMSSSGESFTWGTSPVSVYVPDGVIVADYAFSGCSALTSVRLPEDLTAIGAGTFHSCSALPSVDIPDSVVSIGEAAFYDCALLDGVVLPPDLTSMGREAFYGCASLTSINLHANITSIGARAFYGCTSLSSN